MLTVYKTAWQKQRFCFCHAILILSILVHPCLVIQIPANSFLNAFLSSKQTVNGLDDNLYNIDVLPFVEAADVISVSCLALVEDKGFISRTRSYEWIFALFYEPPFGKFC